MLKTQSKCWTYLSRDKGATKTVKNSKDDEAQKRKLKRSEGKAQQKTPEAEKLKQKGETQRNETKPNSSFGIVGAISTSKSKFVVQHEITTSSLRQFNFQPVWLSLLLDMVMEHPRVLSPED